MFIFASSPSDRQALVPLQVFQNRPKRGWILYKIAQVSVVRAALQRWVHSRGRKGRYEQMARISGEFVQGGIELPNRRGLNLLS